MKVIVVTQAYNAKNFIEKSINSVLNQTYKNFEYILIDNGSNDGSEEIMKSFADKDSRITLVRHDDNAPARWQEPLLKSNGDYFMMIDADDWLEPDCLERLTALALSSDADITVTGSVMHLEETNQQTTRAPQKRIILDKSLFAQEFSKYHVYFRPVWGKLFKMKTVRETHIPTINETGIHYGMDTLTSFAFLKNSSRICLDNSVLHHYRINKKSVSYQYNPTRSDSDLYLYNDAVNFLSAYGPISEENRRFINIVYANAITDTLGVIDGCKLPPAEKLKECRKIMERTATKEAYLVDHPNVNKSKGLMLVQALKCGDCLPDENDDFRYIVDTVLPVCGSTVCKNNIRLFAYDNSLLNSLATDNCDKYLSHVMDLICEKKYTKQFDLGEIVCGLARNNPLLSNVRDTKFLRKHREIYIALWNKQYIEALHAMTDYLITGKNPDEVFLQLYLTLSAALEKVDEFLFGKTKAAVFYFKQKRYEECRETLSDLAEMGVEDTEEIARIKQALN